MTIQMDAYRPEDVPALVAIWNEVVADGMAFPQVEQLTEQTGAEFFAQMDHVGVARVDGQVAGMYILHPNNIGRCGHQCNTSYAVASSMRGKKVGQALVADSLEQAKRFDYQLMIFNAVVKGNDSAIAVYEKLGFHKVGEIPKGFLLKTGEYQDIIVFYHTV